MHTDATDKCVYQGYPVLMVGSTDKTKVFHPFGLALVHKETSHEYEFIHKSIITFVQKVQFIFFVHVPTLTFNCLFTLYRFLVGLLTLES